MDLRLRSEWLDVYDKLFLTNCGSSWLEAQSILVRWNCTRTVTAFANATLPLLDALLSLDALDNPAKTNKKSIVSVTIECNIAVIEFVNKVIKVPEHIYDTKGNLHTVHELARFVGLPAEFVDKRNVAVHFPSGNWPPISSHDRHLLVMMWNWIKQHYWDKERERILMIQNDIMPVIEQHQSRIKLNVLEQISLVKQKMDDQNFKFTQEMEFSSLKDSMHKMFNSILKSDVDLNYYRKLAEMKGIIGPFVENILLHEKFRKEKKQQCTCFYSVKLHLNEPFRDFISWILSFKPQSGLKPDHFSLLPSTVLLISLIDFNHKQIKDEKHCTGLFYFLISNCLPKSNGRNNICAYHNVWNKQKLVDLKWNFQKMKLKTIHLGYLTVPLRTVDWRNVFIAMSTCSKISKKSKSLVSLIRNKKILNELQKFYDRLKNFTSHDSDNENHPIIHPTNFLMNLPETMQPDQQEKTNSKLQEHLVLHYEEEDRFRTCIDDCNISVNDDDDSSVYDNNENIPVNNYNICDSRIKSVVTSGNSSVKRKKSFKKFVNTCKKNKLK